MENKSDLFSAVVQRQNDFNTFEKELKQSIEI